MRTNLLNRDTLAAVGPYAVWMGLLFGFEPTAMNYALRTALTASAIAAFLPGTTALFPLTRGSASRLPVLKSLLWGLAVGLLVCILWIAPETIPAYRDFSLVGLIGLGGGGVASSSSSPYQPETCGWALTLVRLIGSAFVIAPVEELFFRSFLYRWLQQSDWRKPELMRFDLSAFLWMVALFALEHHTRLAAGAMAGAAYGYLAVRKGVVSAIVAHVTTNLLLGLYVIATGQWGFW